MKFTCVNHSEFNPQSFNGTSFHGVEISASLEELRARFGDPMTGSSDGKTNHEWLFFGPGGRRVTLYDYKYDGSREQYWHVGARDRRTCEEFVEFFRSSK
jgi:hypothetical protein